MFVHLVAVGSDLIGVVGLGGEKERGVATFDTHGRSEVCEPHEPLGVQRQRRFFHGLTGGGHAGGGLK